MKIFILLSVSLSCASISWSNAKTYAIDRPGEFYEYDVEGSRGHQVRHWFARGIKNTISAPFRATRWVSVKIIRQSRGMVNAVERFFSNSRSINGQRSQIQYALNNWQTQLDHNNYHNLEGRDRDVSLMLIASDSWHLLKSALYNAGVRLPKETYRTLRAMVYGAFSCVAEK